MINLNVLVISVALFCSAFAVATGDHADEHDEQTTGSHGGRLLEQDDFALEITLYEQGVPSEMRVYAYEKNQPVAPQQITLTVTLTRLGGEQEFIAFTSEDDYLVSNVVIEEPHSFEVTVAADFQGKAYHWHFDSFEGRSEITDRLIKLAGIETAQAGSQTLSITNALYGVVSVAEDRQYRVHAPYPGIVESVSVNTGDRVKKGQALATVRNQATLQSYSINSPATGEVTARMVNTGDHSASGSLLEISDLSRVWVELSLFPADIEQLRVAMPVRVNDLHQHNAIEGEISYISPQMTDGHIARARIEISNAQGHWRPGMRVQAQVAVEQYPAALAVKRSALQRYQDQPAVFVRYGNTFEVRTLTLGRQDAHYVEVLSGLQPGSEYVTANSFLLKAEVLKAGASHDH